MATFQSLGGGSIESASCVCIGAGRFLRAVLVPALREAGESVIIAQPRGTSFGAYMARRAPSATYEVDCVAVDGSVATTEQAIVAVGSLGSDAGKAAFMALPTTADEVAVSTAQPRWTRNRGPWEQLCSRERIMALKTLGWLVYAQRWQAMWTCLSPYGTLL